MHIPEFATLNMSTFVLCHLAKVSTRGCVLTKSNVVWLLAYRDRHLIAYLCISMLLLHALIGEVHVMAVTGEKKNIYICLYTHTHIF